MALATGLNVNVRAMTTDDVGRVQVMAARFLSDEGPYGTRFRASSARIAALVARMALPDALGLIAEHEGAAVGMFGAFCFEHPMTGDLTAAELCWWIEPEARGSRVGLALLRAGEQWARARGAVYLEMIAPTERVGRFYERIGYARTDVHYLKRL